jgi:hypothetical protein
VSELTVYGPRAELRIDDGSCRPVFLCHHFAPITPLDAFAGFLLAAEDAIRSGGPEPRATYPCPIVEAAGSVSRDLVYDPRRASLVNEVFLAGYNPSPARILASVLMGWMSELHPFPGQCSAARKICAYTWSISALPGARVRAALDVYGPRASRHEDAPTAHRYDEVELNELLDIMRTEQAFLVLAAL